MVANPDICRANGRRSRGPVTTRGKAVASRNATRHGLLAKLPPLLVTEDLETFQGIVQGLIDEYQPQGATELLLIQQAAMGWLRLHRLWGVEAALASKAILEAQMRSRYPGIKIPGTLSSDDSAYLDKYLSHAELRRNEINQLNELIQNLEYDLGNVPADGKPSKKWLEAVVESLSLANPRGIEVGILVWEARTKLMCAIEEPDGKPLTVTEIVGRCHDVLKLARERILVVEGILADIDRMERETQLADANSKGLQNPELFTRYEKAITTSLYDALDRLQAIQQQRQQADSMGSFDCEG